MLSAIRRVARTIFKGSVPTACATQRGINDRQVKLGCVMPGKSPQVFGDAVRSLAAQTTYLYQDGPRYSYSTQATVTKLADGRAQQLERDPDRIHAKLKRRLERDLRFSPRNASSAATLVASTSCPPVAPKSRTNWLHA